MGNKNKDMGSRAERYFRTKLIEAGFTFCRTARQASRIHDDAGIDFTGLPFNLQSKAGQQKGLRASNVLKYMKSKIIELFGEQSQEYKNINIMVHHQRVGPGKKRTEEDDIVSMSFEDFLKLAKKTWLSK